MKRLAIIGSGISGLGLAWFLRHTHELVVFEADTRPGGHAHTVTVDEAGTRVSVDTGFMVFNQVTYPLLTRLFLELKVPITRTDMSFSVQHKASGLEYSGSSLNHLFAQRRNLFRPSFLRMLRQIDRFNREALEALKDETLRTLSLGDYVARRGYGSDFLNLYLIPMSSAVWSTPPDQMLRFPAASLLRFFHNHGFLGLHTQHPWWTIKGGSRVYVERLMQPIQEKVFLGCPVRSVKKTPTGSRVSSDAGSWDFDQVVFACHPPETLRILGAEATPQERQLLSAFAYQPNRTTLHKDTRVLPSRKLARASWNYRIDAPSPGQDLSMGPVSTHYWMNRLQPLEGHQNYFVSINGGAGISPEKRLLDLDYEHPLFDLGAIRAQEQMQALNESGIHSTGRFFAGAWQRYGFHEDGLNSAYKLATLLRGTDPWPDSPAS